MTIWYECDGAYEPVILDENDLDGKEVTCDDFKNEIYVKAMEIIKTWTFTVDITRDEIDAAWNAEPVRSYFKPVEENVYPTSYGWFYDHAMVEKFRELKVQISKMYQDKLNRYPTRDEMQFSFDSCFWDYVDGRKKCREAYEVILKGRKVDIDRCPVCGKMVYAECPMFLDHAGEITMGFGYGSRRDLDYGRSYIHDHCSVILDQRLFKVRMNWNTSLRNDGRLDLEKWEKDGEWAYEPNLKFEGDALDQIFHESSFDYANNEEYEKKKNETKDQT